MGFLHSKSHCFAYAFFIWQKKIVGEAKIVAKK
jgi:hypothetical protein